MESTPVNWEALDALVIDFAKSENLIEDSSMSSSSSPPSSLSVHSSPSSSSSPSLSSSSYHSRLIIRQIRRSLESGEVDAAIDLLRAHAPFILDDHRLLFRLHKQVVKCVFSVWMPIKFHQSWEKESFLLLLLNFYFKVLSYLFNSVFISLISFELRFKLWNLRSQLSFNFIIWNLFSRLIQLINLLFFSQFFWRNLLSYWEEEQWRIVILRLIAWGLLLLLVLLMPTR